MSKRGFSLAELLVVIAIISIMATLVLVNYGESRKIARDELRIAHIEQLSVALRLYAEDNGGFLKEATLGVDQGRIGVGGPIDALLIPYMDEIPVDPRGNPNDITDPVNETYFYYYDGYHHCDTNIAGDLNIVVYANTLESASGNRQTLCSETHTEPSFAPQDGNADGYYHVYSFTQNSS